MCDFIYIQEILCLQTTYFFSDLSEFACSQQLQVGAKSTGLYYLLKPLFFIRRPKQDVIP